MLDLVPRSTWKFKTYVKLSLTINAIEQDVEGFNIYISWDMLCLYNMLVLNIVLWLLHRESNSKPLRSKCFLKSAS